MSDSERLLVRVVGDDIAPAELPRAGVLVIGSSKEKAGYVVTGQGVAEVHCAIGIVKGGGWAVKDMGSEFGTLINGKKVKSARVKLGDVILLGSKRLTIVTSEELEATPETKPAPTPKTEAKPEPTKPAAPIAPELSETQRAPLLGGYRIERTLGRGAMGKVFLAVQESLDRQVALKVMAPHLAKDAAFVERFQAEARAAAALSHPNVVTVHDVGEQKGFHYLSMEFMDRGSLEDLLAERGRISVRETLEALRDAANGLVFAESRNIVHRDIKPANLMRNHLGATKIADLGLATNVEAESELEDEGGKKVFGTPHFISPEQLRGETVDCRSDLYSLGATLYQLLTGETAFSGESTREILRGHLFEDAPRVRDSVSEVSAELDDLVARLLQKDPAERYQSAGDLLADTQRLLAQESGTAVSAPSGGGSKLVPILLVVLVLVGAGVFFSGALGGSDKPDKTTPDDPPKIIDAGDNGSNPDAPVTPLTPDDGTKTVEVTTPKEPVVDDRDLRIFELEADQKFLRLKQEDLATAARVERLRALATEYDGTDAASKARDEANALENASTEELERVTALDKQRRNLMGSLKQTANLETEIPEPAAALKALSELVIPEEFATDPAIATERTRLQQLVIQKALDFAKEKHAASEAAGEAGDRATFVSNLAAIVNALEVPVVEGEVELPGLAELRATRDTAQTRLSSVNAVLNEYAAARAARASLKMANSFGSGAGLEAELQQLNLTAALTRLDATLKDLPTAAARGVLEKLREDVAAAQGSLEFIGGTFSSWRRKKVDDPRTGKSATATGSSTLGVSIDGEFLGWAEFGSNTACLAQLFDGRVDADYTAEIHAGILALLRISAALEVIDGASEMFFPKDNAQFTPSEAEDLVKPFDVAAEWLSDSDTEAKQALALEREAAQLLGRALRSTDEGRWNEAVADMQRLLSEYANSLVVLLMSDGTGSLR